MREIKFRYWDLLDGKLKYIIPQYQSVTSNDVKGKYITIPLDDIDLMQYTGLKDKNGVEIYEGDIVHCREYGFGKIEWNEEDACFYFYAVYECGFDKENIYDYLEDMEVIGNKYENLELLIVGGGVGDY